MAHRPRSGTDRAYDVGPLRRLAQPDLAQDDGRSVRAFLVAPILVTGIVLATAWITFSVQIRMEEHLHRMRGSAYERYRTVVPRWIVPPGPRINGACRPGRSCETWVQEADASILPDLKAGSSVDRVCLSPAGRSRQSRKRELSGATLGRIKMRGPHDEAYRIGRGPHARACRLPGREQVHAPPGADPARHHGADGKGMSQNDPILMRAYKKESEIEVWKRGPTAGMRCSRPTRCAAGRASSGRRSARATGRRRRASTRSPWRR